MQAQWHATMALNSTSCSRFALLDLGTPACFFWYSALDMDTQSAVLDRKTTARSRKAAVGANIVQARGIDELDAPPSLEVTLIPCY